MSAEKETTAVDAATMPSFYFEEHASDPEVKSLDSVQVEPADDPLAAYSDYSTEEAMYDGLLVEPMQYSFPKCVLSLSVSEAIKESITIPNESTFDKTAKILKDAVLLVTKRFNNAKNISMTDVEAIDQVRVMQNCLENNVTGKSFLISVNELGGITITYPEDF